MRLTSWNLNGYRAAWKKDFLDWLDADLPDILCLQETKAWEEQLTPEQRAPLGYHARFSKPERKGYSGVATLAYSEFDVVNEGYGIKVFDCEGRVIISRHPGFLLANIYFPNGKSRPARLEYKLDFYEATLKHFKELRKQGEKLIVVGDYNTAHKPIDLARPKENVKISGFLPVERAWIDRWIEAGFVDIFRRFNTQPAQYTWWDMRTRARDRNIGWRIDYFFVSDNLANAVQNATISMDVMGSDHCPLSIELDEAKL
jgi:exodeoxyribonuclease-3